MPPHIFESRLTTTPDSVAALEFVQLSIFCSLEAQAILSDELLLWCPLVDQRLRRHHHVEADPEDHYNADQGLHPVHAGVIGLVPH